MDAISTTTTASAVSASITNLALAYLTERKPPCKIILEVDAFVTNHVLIDPEIFQLWVDGFNAPEAGQELQARGALLSFPGANFELLMSDVQDQYRNFEILEKFLSTPMRLNDQWIFQLDPITQDMLVQRYYEFDDTVMREILGKKLSSRQRKDLDEVSEKTMVNLKSCRRQFDNAKRVFKTIEEMPGSIFENIQAQFFLEDELAKKYEAIVFIAGNRFETSKRKLNYMTFVDFYNSAHSMLRNWCSTNYDASVMPSDVDREFLMDLRDLKVFFDKEKEHKSLALHDLKLRVSDKTLNEVEQNFKAYSRTLINIAVGLNHSKELKDLFIDLVEKYIEPCKNLHWPLADFQAFLEVFRDSAFELDVLKSQTTLRSIWKRYMDGIIGILISCYHN